MEATEFSVPQNVQTVSEAYPVSSYSVGTWAFSARVKRPEREADCSPPSNADVKNEWRYTCLHGIPAFLCLHGVCRGNFIF
jgi:hypothetical protein